MGWLRYALAYLAAVIGMAVTGTVVQSQFVLAALSQVGADIAMGDAVSMTMDDLAGFAPLYAGFIALGFAIAFAVAGLAIRLGLRPRAAVYAGSGLVCMAVMLYLMETVFFGVPVIAGARSAAGVIAQAGLGALWGWVFAAISASRRHS